MGESGMVEGVTKVKERWQWVKGVEAICRVWIEMNDFELFRIMLGLHTNAVRWEEVIVNK